MLVVVVMDDGGVATTLMLREAMDTTNLSYSLTNLLFVRRRDHRCQQALWSDRLAHPLVKSLSGRQLARVGKHHLGTGS